jgi:peptidoglycan hydrolase CwlO-like protein
MIFIKTGRNYIYIFWLNIQTMYSLIILLLVVLFFGSFFVSQSFAQEKIVPFEKRLNDQLTNNSNNSNNSNFENDVSLLDKPRNTTMQQIKSNNETINQLYNNSIQTMEEGSENTRQNISEILSLLR